MRKCGNILWELPLLLNILVVYPDCANQYDNFVCSVSKTAKMENVFGEADSSDAL